MGGRKCVLCRRTEERRPRAWCRRRAEMKYQPGSEKGSWHWAAENPTCGSITPQPPSLPVCLPPFPSPAGSCPTCLLDLFPFMTHQDLHPSPPDLNSPDNGITIAPSLPTFSILTGLSSFLFTWIMKQPLVLVLFGYTLLCNFLPRKTRVTIYCQHNNLHVLEWRSQTLTSQVFISTKTFVSGSLFQLG